MNGWKHEKTVDLSRDHIGGEMIRVAHRDSKAHRWIVNLVSDGSPVDLSGYTAKSVFLRGDGATVFGDAEISGSTVTAVIPSLAYGVTGMVFAAITLTGSDDEVITVDTLRLDVFVKMSDRSAPEDHLVLVTDQDLETESQSLTGAINELLRKLVEKQNALVSGENIKTINGAEILGSGDLLIDAESVGALPKTTKIPSKTSDLTNDSGYVGSEAIKDLATKKDLEGLAKESDLADLVDESELATALSGKAPKVHEHNQSEINGLSNALAGKAPTNHHHDQSDVNGLSKALSDKANASEIARIDESLIQHSETIAEHTETISELERTVEDKADKSEIPDITGKLDRPDNAAVVGKILKIKSVNEDGSIVCEWVDDKGATALQGSIDSTQGEEIPRGNGLDVQINGSSIVSGGVAPIPIANENAKLGLMRGSQTYGFNMDMYGYIRGLGLSAAEFANADSRAFVCKSTLNNVLDTLPVFYWCEYGVTTYEEAIAALNKGKLLMCERDNRIYTFSEHITTTGYIYLSQFNSYHSQSRFLTLNSKSVWASDYNAVELTFRRKNTMTDSNTDYPTTHAVVEYAEPKQKDFVLIDDFTPESDMSNFEKKVCPDGTPYAFNEVIITAYRPSGISHTNYNSVTMWDKDGKRCRNELGRISDANTAARMATLYLEKHGNFAISNRWTFTGENDNPGECVQMGANPLINGTTSSDRSFTVGFSTIINIVFDKVYAGQRYVIYAR